MDLLDIILDAYNKPDPKQYLFDVGQVVRVRNFVVEDGQTPGYWAGARAVVDRRWTTGLHKDHIYHLRLDRPSGPVTCEFREYELDSRFRRQA